MNIFLSAGALLGMLAVIIGAFGAHGLENTLSSHALERYQTGVEYQFYHVGALLYTGLLNMQKTKKHLYLNFSGIAFIIGIILFSGSLYLYAITGITKFGIVTPIGGFALILGWLLLLIYSVKKQI